MKKISLAVLGLYVSFLACFSQNQERIDSSYKTRKLKFEETNFVSSYYHQEGDRATVTGGIGSQKLTDISTTIDVKLVRYDRASRRHNLTAELGIDHYSSASSDKIDPSAMSSASRNDNRLYPSIGWSMEDEDKGRTVGAGLFYSSEYDYQSFGGNLSFAKKTRDRSGEFSAKLQAYFDYITGVYPIELRAAMAGVDVDLTRKTFSGTLSWSQIINKSLQVLLESELVYQKGYLGLPFHRVYFTDNSVHIEKLPTSRLKIPIGARANYFLGDRLILRAWLRYYYDSWHVHSNTVQLETSIKLNPFFSVTPFYRFYHQSAADYFAGFKEHTSGDQYYTSNYDFARFNSHFFGAGFRMAPPGGVFGIGRVNALEIRYGHYQKNIDLNANIISVHVKFK